jgi:hypothetical protein
MYTKPDSAYYKKKGYIPYTKSYYILFVPKRPYSVSQRKNLFSKLSGTQRAWLANRRGINYTMNRVYFTYSEYTTMSKDYTLPNKKMFRYG